VRREVIEQVGGFDESFVLYAEETDWQRRMHDAGWRVRYKPGETVVHLGGASSGTMRDCQLVEFCRNPWSTLVQLATQAAANATFIISLSNVGHWFTLLTVWGQGRWRRNERGVHDRTHLRWFTRRDMIEFAEGADLRIKQVHDHKRLIEWPCGFNHRRLVRLLCRLPTQLPVHQTLIVAEKSAPCGEVYCG
jgi:GT2 family glycosyltransferase